MPPLDAVGREVEIGIRVVIGQPVLHLARVQRGFHERDHLVESLLNGPHAADRPLRRTRPPYPRDTRIQQAADQLWQLTASIASDGVAPRLALVPDVAG